MLLPNRRVPVKTAAFLAVAVLLLLLFNSHCTERAEHRVHRFDPYELDLHRDDAKQALCSRHGWKPFPGSGRRVYDLIMVNTELDWLEIRFNTTYDFVDYFVVVESPKTFTNLDKPLIIKENMDKFSAYRDKIIYHELVIPDGFHSERENPAWAWEDLQRNAMYDQVLPYLEGARAPADGDVIIVADVDELVRPETLALLRTCDYPRRLNLRSSFYYYSFQFLHVGEQWSHPQATYYQGQRTILPTNLRNSDGNLPPIVKMESGDLWDAGWHCSSCFATIEELLTKMASFSHVSFNQEYFRDKDRIAEHIREGKDIWDRKGQTFERIDNNQDVPHFF
jgi:beta-1,4-mannosyl-glycoprotein beta-1,4-N-acetylglucosaminyltransferase